MRLIASLILLPVLAVVCVAASASAQSAGSSRPTTQPSPADFLYLTNTIDDAAFRNIELLRQGTFVTTPNLDVQLYNPPPFNTVRLVFTPSTSETAYLGIGVESPGDTLRAQLVLPEGAGLVVNYVDEKAPSNGVVHKHDVLQKLDDQILINAEQLITLVRMHKPGETVALTLIREATPQTVQVKLGARQDDAMHTALFPYTVQDLSGGITWTSPPAAPATLPAGVPVLKDIPYVNRLFVTPVAPSEIKSPPITFNDGDLLACIDAAGNLLGIDVKTGSLIFRGPIITQEQWKNAPPIVRDKLAAWKALIAPPAPGDNQQPNTGKK